MFRIFGHYVPKELFLLGSTENLILLISVYLSITYGATVSMIDAPIWPKAILFSAVMLSVMTAMGMYQREVEGDASTVMTRILLSFFLGATLLTLIYTLFPEMFFGRNVFFIAMGCSFFGILACRMVWYFRNDQMLKEKTLVIGAGKKAQQLDRLKKATESGIKIVGYVDIEDASECLIKTDDLIEIESDFSNLLDVIQENNVKEIVMALDERRNVIQADQILECRMRGIKVVDMNNFLERQLGKIFLSTLQPSTLIYSDGFIQGKFKSFLKRIFDLVISSTVLLLTLPIMLLTALLIWVESGFKGTIFYSQERVGANNQTFEIFKFRSMTENAETNGEAVWAQKNDNRVTHVGKFIRLTRIDELPQLYNVLKGDMSFVGPRPERPQFVGNLSEEIPFYSLRHHIKPGITGWAQICYPYGASVSDAREKLQYDLYYLKNNTFFLDLLIMLQTAAVILLCRGAR